MSVAADVEPTPLHLDPQRTAIGKAIQVFDGKA